MALSPTKDDPNREAELERRKRDPWAFNVRPSVEVQKAARRLNMPIEEYMERHCDMPKKDYHALYEKEV